MTLIKILLTGFIILILAGCNVFRNSPKYGFAEGYYHSRIFHKKDKDVYVVPTSDSIKIYTAMSLKKRDVDSVSSLKLAFPVNHKPDSFTSYFFRKNTFDLDVLTIPFKFRPAVAGFPPQLNATFNGAVYIGYRSDLYHLKYQQTPLRIFKRQVMHYGYSFGLFSGLGMARIDEYVTNNNLNIQYDGAVSLNGVAFIVAINNLSVGLASGVDYLLDPNRRFWVNQTKPWVGLSVGLNLN